jgi:hypothetical protein
MTTKRMGVSLDAAPAVKEIEVEDKPSSGASKQTIMIGRKGLKRIRNICIEKDITFQDFAIRALNRELNAIGEPSIEELEAAE